MTSVGGGGGGRASPVDHNNNWCGTTAGGWSGEGGRSAGASVRNKEPPTCRRYTAPFPYPRSVGNDILGRASVRCCRWNDREKGGEKTGRVMTVVRDGSTKGCRPVRFHKTTRTTKIIAILRVRTRGVRVRTDKAAGRQRPRVLRLHYGAPL